MAHVGVFILVMCSTANESVKFLQIVRWNVYMHVIIVKMPGQNNAVLIGRLNDGEEANICIINVKKKKKIHQFLMRVAHLIDSVDLLFTGIFKP